MPLRQDAATMRSPRLLDSFANLDSSKVPKPSVANAPSSDIAAIPVAAAPTSVAVKKRAPAAQ
jgi:hypothetical protein